MVLSIRQTPGQKRRKCVVIADAAELLTLPG